ncbi:MAG TPA: phosphonopyruvate decarboxylase [Flavisolibacter sp.]|jgi:phosphonopyruvate decarboxylase|nr:phosphonopyruvate decarboxylase [Flavisolibacter sp.]
MIQPHHFLQELTKAGIQFYAGVPDSLLKGLITAIARRFPEEHFITANEGAAIGLATGFYLATENIPAVYLQNSGLGNIINPLTSLTDKDMYGIPMLLIIGWRGEPGVKDEPQHLVMGKITPTLLHQLNVPFIVLKKSDEHDWIEAVHEAVFMAKDKMRPVALLVESGVFPEDELQPQNNYELSAEEAITLLYEQLAENDIVICTTGKIGRAFYQINESKKKITRYFLNVGSMGHAVSIATGLAMYVKQRVVLLDGDGALLMHMGAMALPAFLKLQNFAYIILNNGAHGSVGAQPTLGFHIDFCTIAKGCGFQNPIRISSRKEMESLSENFNQADFLEIRINTQSNVSLPRPKATPLEAKAAFMKALGKSNQ